jgi:hypothetical protein
MTDAQPLNQGNMAALSTAQKVRNMVMGPMLSTRCSGQKRSIGERERSNFANQCQTALPWQIIGSLKAPSLMVLARAAIAASIHLLMARHMYIA